MTTLLMSSRNTDDNQTLWRAAIGRGWSVERVRGLRVPQFNDSEIILYIESLFAPAIARQIGVSLLDVPQDWLVNVPSELSRRSIELTTLGKARQLIEAKFVKSPNDKSFAARVYSSGAELPEDFHDETPVLISEPVQWVVEFRCFCLDGTVRTLSPYLHHGVLAKHEGFRSSTDERRRSTELAESILADVSNFTPRAVVIDVGEIADRGWAVVEANAAWGSGIYGCDPDAALDVISHATVRR